MHSIEVTGFSIRKYQLVTPTFRMLVVTGCYTELRQYSVFVFQKR